MEKIFFIKNHDLNEINNLLSNGWNVKIITPCEQNVSTCGSSHSTAVSSCFVYIVLRKDETNE